MLLPLTIRPDPLVFSYSECFTQQLTLCASRLALSSWLEPVNLDEPFDGLPPIRISANICGHCRRLSGPPPRLLVIRCKGVVIGTFSIATPILLSLNAGTHASVHRPAVRSQLLRAPRAAPLRSYASAGLGPGRSVPLSTVARIAACRLLGLRTLAGSELVITELCNAVFAAAACLFSGPMVASSLPIVGLLPSLTGHAAWGSANPTPPS